MKSAFGATRDDLALRWESCGAGCRRSISDWAPKGYRLTTARRAVENDGRDVLQWGRVYPRSWDLATPDYGVLISQYLDGSQALAAVGFAFWTGLACDLHLHTNGAGVTYVLETEPTTTKLMGAPLGRIDATSFSSVRYLAYKDLVKGGVTSHSWSTLSSGFLHIQTYGPPGLAIVKLEDGPIVTQAVSGTPAVELPRTVAGGSVGGDYLSGTGQGALWFVGNDGVGAKIHSLAVPYELRWFDVDRRRADTIVWVEYDTTGEAYSLWESSLATTTGGAKPKKVHTQANPYGSFVANAGAVLFKGDGESGIKIVRMSDGGAETLSVPSADRALDPVWVDEKEAWFVTEPVTTAPAGRAASWIVRVAR